MKRNKFGLSHYKLLTASMGYLIPLTWMETLPGDTVRMASSLLIRCSPLLAPVMHPVQVRVHHWFVPLRLLWEDWENFITGGEDGDDESVPPYISTDSISEGSLHDYLGIPPDSYSPNLTFSALPFRAYNKIYNERYRDQDLVESEEISLEEGQDSTTNTDLLKAAWSKDYFTTARPWETKGDEVTIPISGDVPVTGIGKDSQAFGESSINVYETGASGTRTYASLDQNSVDIAIEEDPDNAGYPNIRAQLDEAGAGLTINDLRLALAIQRYQEARGRYGSRYVEYLRSLGVKSSDARLDGPEYLGGGRQIIQFSEVLSTDGSNTGDMKGHGIGAMRTKRFLKFFEEHGIIMTLMSVVPKAIYTQGLHKSFSREIKEHYYQKELASIGEQQVLNKELYAVHSEPDEIFGYQARYDEYRWLPSSIAGEFRSTLDHWHYARIFSGEPGLNQTFTDCTPTKRVNADTESDVLYIMSNHQVQARRLMPRFARPKTF